MLDKVAGMVIVILATWTLATVMVLVHVSKM